MPVEIERTELDGVLLVKSRILTDHRGFFMEAYSRDSWAAQGLHEVFIQDNLSLSIKGTLRGMHYQLATHGQGKLVRALRGAIFDVAVDLRRGSPTFGRWVGYELTGDNGLAMWVPVGFAHGFIAIEDASLVLYKCTGSHYAPQAERSLHYNDPQVNIQWPIPPTAIAKKDEDAPTLENAEYDFVYEGPSA